MPVCLAATLLARVLAAFPSLSDFPGAPPLNASADEFEYFHDRLVHAFHESLAADDWKPYATQDGVNTSYRTDPRSGCPWVRGEADLPNCPLQDSAAFIITETDKSERSWDKTLVDNIRLRTLGMTNGSQRIDWHIEEDSLFLEQRMYYLYDGWRRGPDEVFEDAVTSVYHDHPPPAGYRDQVRSVQWSWRRLSSMGRNSTRYEVAWLSDVKGMIPCTFSASAQAQIIRKEVDNFRKLIPKMHASSSGSMGRIVV